MDTDVLIIGGGLSGLSLAWELEKAGRDYRLLEARARLGGRILSRASHGHEDSNDRYDLGSAWIWPHQLRVRQLIDEFGLRVFDQYASGRLVLQEGDGSVRRDLNFSTMAGSQRIVGGVGRLIEHLADSLPTDRILTQHRVTKIHRAQLNNETLVEVFGQTGDDAFKVSVKTVVLAVPPRVVSKIIDFGADLPSKAIDTMAAVSTWMAAHAKVITVYEQPFWRHLGLSGDGISRCGPLVELHDATPLSEKQGGLFGFVGIPVGSEARERDRLIKSSIEQLTTMYGAKAGNPLDVIVIDWAKDPLTATHADYKEQSDHSADRAPSALTNLWGGQLILSSTEMSPANGGYLEGALEASESAVSRIVTTARRRHPTSD